MAADMIGWQEAIWAPLCICLVPILLLLYSIFSTEREILRPKEKSSLYPQNLQMVPQIKRLIRSRSLRK